MRNLRKFAVILIASLACVASHEPATASDRKPTLSWCADEHTLLRYELVKVPTRVTGIGKFRKELIFFANEVDEDGEWESSLVDLHGSDMLFRFAMVVPDKKPKVGRKWNAKFDALDYPGTTAYFPNMTSCEYEVTAIDDDIATVSCVASGNDAAGRQRGADKGVYDPVVQNFKADITVTFDMGRGLMTGFKGTSEIAAGNNTVESSFEYRLGGTVSFETDAEFKAAVQKAIDDGLKYLASQRKDWESNAGRAGLTAYTMMQCDTELENGNLQQGLRSMIDEFAHTYHASIVILAIEAKYISQQERQMIRGGTPPRKFYRELSDLDRSRMEKAVTEIEQNIMEGGAWTYGKNVGTKPEPDLSNTQFAALGLAAASRCGLEIPVGLVRRGAMAVTEYQETEGDEVKRVIGRDGDKWLRAKKAATARSFRYKKDIATRTGSMTSAGVSSHLLFLDVLDSFTEERRELEFESSDVSEKEWRSKIEDSIDGGLAWLDQNVGFRQNPGQIPSPHDYYFFYLYSLERVGSLARVDYIGEHDWYRQGATMLLLHQQDDGRWRNVQDTCFALLFLQRATTPTRRVWTGK